MLRSEAAEIAGFGVRQQYQAGLPKPFNERSLLFFEDGQDKFDWFGAGRLRDFYPRTLRSVSARAMRVCAHLVIQPFVNLQGKMSAIIGLESFYSRRLSFFQKPQVDVFIRRRAPIRPDDEALYAVFGKRRRQSKFDIGPMFALFQANDSCLRLERDAGVIRAWIRQNLVARRTENAKAKQIISGRRKFVELEKPLGVGFRMQKSVRAADVGRRAPHFHRQVGHRLSNCVNNAPADARVWEKVEINWLATVFDDISLRFGHCPAARPVTGHTVWDFELDGVSAWRQARNAITALLIRSRFNAQRFSLDDQIG